MSRELKFRAWDGRGGCHHFGIEPFVFNAVGVYLCPVGNTMSPAEPTAIVEEWTGLHDKNGVEICEGDIVTCGMLHGDKWVPHNAVIKWDGDFAAFVAYMPSIDDDQMMDSRGGMEVIGNIHENPELLENA